MEKSGVYPCFLCNIFQKIHLTISMRLVIVNIIYCFGSLVLKSELQKSNPFFVQLIQFWTLIFYICVEFQIRKLKIPVFSFIF